MAREQPTDGETVTTPNPADTGSGGVAAVASSRAARTPLNWGVVNPSRGDRLFRNLARRLRRPDRRVDRGDRGVPADPRDPRADPQSGQLLHLRRQLGHHQHRGDAVRGVRPGAGDVDAGAVRPGTGDAGGVGHRDLPGAVLAAAGDRAAGLRDRPARSGPVDHLRGLGPVRAGPAAATGGDLAQPASGWGLPVRDRQRIGVWWRDHLHRRRLCWR